MRHSNSYSSAHLLGPVLHTENSGSSSDSGSNSNTIMKTPEGTTRTKRSVLRKITGWWKKKNSYYMDIHQELRQDCTLFPEEESMGSFQHQDDDDVFDASSVTPTRVAAAQRDDDAKQQTRSLLETPQTPHFNLIPPPETPLRNSSTTPVVAKTARSRVHTQHYTPRGSIIVPSSSPDTPMRQDNNNTNNNDTPLMEHSTPTFPEVDDADDWEPTPLGSKPLVPQRHLTTPATTPRVSNRHTAETPAAAWATPEAWPCVFSPPIFPNSSNNNAQQFSLPAEREEEESREQPTTPRSASASHSSRTQQQQQQQPPPSPPVTPPPPNPETPQESLLALPFARTSFSTGSLLSMDSLASADSYCCWKDGDDGDGWSQHTTPPPPAAATTATTTGIFGDFFDEHVTFLRIQTKPRQVAVVWAEDDIQSIH